METGAFVAWLIVVFIVTVILCMLVVWVWYRSTLTNLFWKLAGDAQQVCDDMEENGDLPIRYKHALPANSSGCGMTGYNFETAQALLEIDLAVTAANCECVLPLPTPPGFTYQKRLVAPDPYNGEEHMFAYIFWGREGALISFTGTHYASEWADNLNYSLVPACYLPGSPLVHKGFNQIYEAVRPQIWDWLKKYGGSVETLYISGHSLGGALSTICALDLVRTYPDLIQYSFASPRVGGKTFSETFNAKVGCRGFRVFNTEDIITSTPPAAVPDLKDKTQPPYIYQHVGQGVPFTISLGSLSQDHIQAYQKYLPNCVENGCSR